MYQEDDNMSNTVKITFFLGALLTAFVFTQISVQLINSMFTEFFVLPPSTALESFGAVIIVISAVSCLLFTIALYVCVIWLVVKELSQRQQPPVQPPRQRGPSTSPGRHRVVRPQMAFPRQRHYRPSRPLADDQDWI